MCWTLVEMPNILLYWYIWSCWTVVYSIFSNFYFSSDQFGISICVTAEHFFCLGVTQSFSCYLLGCLCPDSTFLLLDTPCIFFWRCFSHFNFSTFFTPFTKLSLSASHSLHIPISSQPLLSVPLVLFSCLSASTCPLVETLDSTDGTRSADVLPSSLLSQTVHFSVSRKALELARWVRSN